MKIETKLSGGGERETNVRLMGDRGEMGTRQGIWSNYMFVWISMHYLYLNMHHLQKEGEIIFVQYYSWLEKALIVRGSIDIYKLLNSDVAFAQSILTDMPRKALDCLPGHSIRQESWLTKLSKFIWPNIFIIQFRFLQTNFIV